MDISYKKVAELILKNDNIVIFAHRKPDGDTIGSSFALLSGLLGLGKKARIECADPFVFGRYKKLLGEYKPLEFEAEYFISVDVADSILLGGAHEKYGGVINIAIDHHMSNEFYAENTLLEVRAAATAEIMYNMLKELKAPVTKEMANALFLGITTDTGCFKFRNVTASTHRIVADLIEYGADHAYINKLMFDTKSMARLKIESDVLKTLEFYFDNTCAVIYIPANAPEKYGTTEDDIDGITAIPRSIEGIYVGVCVTDRGDGAYRVSVRTENPADASYICSQMGGGGHVNAAGCVIKGSKDKVMEKLLKIIRSELKQKNLWTE